MFEIIGAFLVIYLTLGVFVLSILFVSDAQGMRETFAMSFEDRRWGELAFMLVFSLWCWPIPLIEFLSER
jgi:hypothetical protein